MSDDQENLGGLPRPAGHHAEPDETRQFAPSGGDPEREDPARSSDAGSGDPARPEVSARTAGAPEPGAPGSPDGTAIMAGASGSPDGTAIMPAADGRGPAQPAGTRDPTSALPVGQAAARASAGRADPAWSGRAEVRPRRSGAGDVTPTDWTAPDWTPEPREPRGAWWMPIVVGTVVLILLAVLGVGVWLIAQAGQDDEPGAPVVVPSAAPVSVLPSDTPTSDTPTTPPTSATATEPMEVTIPALVGLSAAEARRALDRVGLTYRVIYRPDDAPVETVIDSDPPEGRQVPADTVVILVLAAPVPTSPVAVPSTSPGVDGQVEQED